MRVDNSLFLILDYQNILIVNFELFLESEEWKVLIQYYVWNTNLLQVSVIFWNNWLLCCVLGAQRLLSSELNIEIWIASELVYYITRASNHFLGSKQLQCPFSVKNDVSTTKKDLKTMHVAATSRIEEPGGSVGNFCVSQFHSSFQVGKHGFVLAEEVDLGHMFTPRRWVS